MGLASVGLETGIFGDFLYSAILGLDFLGLALSLAWKRAAFSQHPRCMNSTLKDEPPHLATRDPCIGGHANQVTHMGYGMRTSEWRYADWPAWRCTGTAGDQDACADMSRPGSVWSGSVDWGDIAGVELYAHQGDAGDCFDCFENQNLADTGEHRSVVATLSKQSRAGWRGAAAAGSAAAMGLPAGGTQ